jgi:hypothetical protein
VFGATRDAVTVSRVTRPGVGGSFDGIRWVKGLLLAVITICAVAGIVSTAALGQTQAALAIGIVALAFFSRVVCWPGTSLGAWPYQRTNANNFWPSRISRRCP